MVKKLISGCIVSILICSICSCAQTAGDTLVDKKVCVGMLNADSAKNVEQGEQTSDCPVPQEESESEIEIDYDGSNTYLPILAEYERAWEDETYTIEQWQDVAGVFMTLTDAKFGLGTTEKDYTLYYSMSDLTGGGTEELIIGIRGEDGIVPCFLYNNDGERIHITDSRTWSDLVDKPTILYENGIIESSEYIKYGMYRYNFYQLPEDWGKMKKIDQYFYIEGVENGTQYYKGGMANTITEEEFWNGINDYESMTQIELDWHELDGFWRPDKNDARTTVVGEYSHGEKKEEPEDEAESRATISEEKKTESKKDEPLTVMSKKIRSDVMWEEYEYDAAGNMTKYTGYLGGDGSFWFGHEYEYDGKGKLTKDTYYGADGDMEYREEYEYDNTGNWVKYIRYDADESIHMWEEYEYDSAGNQTKYISHNADDSISYREEYKYDSAGNQVKRIRYNADGDINYWYEYEYDDEGNQTKTIEYSRSGDIAGWYEWEYDSAGNMTKKNDNFSFVDEYEYDDADNRTRHSYYSDGRLHMWAEYEYDSVGNQTYGITYNADGSIQSIQEYEYDSRGNKTKVTYDYVYGIATGHESEHEWEYIWEYDSMDNLTKYVEYSWGKVFEWYEYEYITIITQ